jgi:hypothetical protein
MAAATSHELPARFSKALTLADLLDAAGVDSAGVRLMDSANWLQAAVAANVRKPSAATRELVLFMLESRERARRIITPAQT